MSSYSRVIGCQECSAVEKQSTTPFTSSNDRDRIGRVSKLWPSLSEVLGSLLDVLSRSRQGERQWRGHEPAASLMGVTIACLVDVGTDPVEVETMRFGDAVQIVVNNSTRCRYCDSRQ